MAEPIYSETDAFQKARREEARRRLTEAATGVPQAAPGIPIAGRERLLLPLMDRLTVYDQTLAELQQAVADGKIDLRKAELAAGSKYVEEVTKLLTTEMTNVAGGQEKRIDAEAEILIKMMDDAREKGPSTSITTPEGTKAYIEMKRSVGHHLAAIAAGRASASGQTFYEDMIGSLSKIPARDRVAALDQLGAESGLEPGQLAWALLKTDADGNPMPAAFDLAGLPPAEGKAASGGFKTAWSQARDLLQEGVRVNEVGAKAEAGLAEQAERLRKSWSGIGDTRLQKYIDQVVGLATGQTGLDDPATREAMAELGVVGEEKQQEAPVTLPPEMAAERARIVQMMDEIQSQADEPDLAARKEAIMTSPGFGDFMDKNGISNPADGWRALNSAVRKMRKGGEFVPRSVPGDLPPSGAAPPPAAPPGSGAPAAPPPPDQAGAVAPVRRPASESPQFAPAADPYAQPTLGAYDPKTRTFAPPSKAVRAVSGGEPVASAAPMEDLAARRRAMQVEHITSRLG